MGKVVCVNLTTLDNECVDDECILDDHDYSWIKPNHPTAVAFSFAQSYDVVKIEQAFKNGILKSAVPNVVPAATLAKVRAIAANARELSRDLKALL